MKDKLKSFLESSPFKEGPPKYAVLGLGALILVFLVLKLLLGRGEEVRKTPPPAKRPSQQAQAQQKPIPVRKPVVTPQKKKPERTKRDDIFYAEALKRLKEQVLRELDEVVERKLEEMKVELEKEIKEAVLEQVMTPVGSTVKKEDSPKKASGIRIEPVKVKYLIPGEKAVVVTKEGELEVSVGSIFPYPECRVVNIERSGIITECNGRRYAVPLVRF